MLKNNNLNVFCTKCEQDKTVDNFYPGNKITCKECRYKRNREILKNRMSNDIDKQKLLDKKKLYCKKWRDENQDIIINGRKKHYKANKAKINKKCSDYRKSNKAKIAAGKLRYMKERKKNDPLYNLMLKVRSLIKDACFRHTNYTKKSRTHEILGCTYQEFKVHLESKFENWMTWENRGKYNGQFNFGWDIDHIIPVSSAKTEEQLLKLNHYTNLQPLCSKYNRHIKSDNYDKA